MVDEEALLVVVGVDEPAGDAVGSVADHLSGLGFEDVHAVHLDAQIAVLPSAISHPSGKGKASATTATSD